MTDHRTETREEWLAARLELLDAEKELTRRSDELARTRQELPWVRIEKDYRFDTDEGTASLADLGWSFPWASSVGSDFNSDFQVSHTEEEWRSGAVEYNFRERDLRPPAGEDSSFNTWAESTVGTDWETYRREGPGVSAFAPEDGVVYHTHSAYERGFDGLWGMYAWLDRAPLGRNETGMWWRRHDEYDNE
jgi:predicted dithiol-disulfide oxidoreductase (DUF899 family)